MMGLRSLTHINKPPDPRKRFKTFYFVELVSNVSNCVLCVDNTKKPREDQSRGEHPDGILPSDIRLGSNIVSSLSDAYLQTIRSFEAPFLFKSKLRIRNVS